MKIKKILKVCFFIFLFLAMNWGVSRLYFKMMSTAKIVEKETAFQKNDLDKTEVLVLGDSHAMYIWQYYQKLQLANWATEGECYIPHYYKLKSFLKTHHPKIVIIPLDLHSFSPKGLNFGHDFFWVKYIDYFELAYITGDYSYIPKYFRGLLFPYVAQQGVFMQWLLKKMDQRTSILQSSHSLLASHPTETVSNINLNMIIPSKPKRNLDYYLLSQEERLAFAKFRVNEMIRANDTLNKYTLMFFEKMLSLCREKRVKVLLVKFPVSKEFYQCATTAMSPDSYYGHIESIVGKYSNAYILDCQQIFFEKPELMFDVDHPNLKEGAKILNKIVRSKLHQILILEEANEN